MKTGEIVMTNPYRYGNMILPPDKRTPNNSPYIVSSLVTAPDPTIKERIRAYFRSFFR